MGVVHGCPDQVEASDTPKVRSVYLVTCRPISVRRHRHCHHSPEAYLSPHSASIGEFTALLQGPDPSWFRGVDPRDRKWRGVRGIKGGRNGRGRRGTEEGRDGGR